MGRRDKTDEVDLRLEVPKWRAVFLVCKDCRRRKNGPDHMKPKALASEIRDHVRRAEERPRILLTSCLGICPKSASAVAFLAPPASPRVVSIESYERVSEALALLKIPDAHS